MKDATPPRRERPAKSVPETPQETSNETSNDARAAAPLAVERCRAAALRNDLVFKVDFGESLIFCDAAYHKDHELHEIVYWDAEEFQEEPYLFEGILRDAVSWDAQFIYTIHPSAG